MSQDTTNKAVILAAGRGKRMGDLTQHLPKAMIPIAGKPMLQHIVERLREAGFERCLVVIGYLGEVIEKHFGTTVEFLRQEVLNGTGSAALLARDFAGEDGFLLTFGDILIDPENYTAMLASLAGNDAVLGVKKVEDPWQGAAVYESDGIVTRIVEKPPKGSSTTNWNSAGVYAFRSDLFAALARLPLSSRGEYELTSAIELMLQQGKKLRICEIHGDWRDVGRPEDLAPAHEIVTDPG